MHNLAVSGSFDPSTAMEHIGQYYALGCGAESGQGCIEAYVLAMVRSSPVH
jgi:hypothetical protein